jgi:topoisomerase-4 subunit A
MGNIISRNFIKKVQLKEDGVSTLGAVNIYYDDTVRRLNTDERGRLLGAFKGDDKILTVMQSGELKFYGFDLSSHFEEDMILLEKFNPDFIITAIYFDGESKKIYVKRFSIEQPQMMKKIPFITEHTNSKLLLATIVQRPVIEIVFNAKKNKKEIPNELLEIESFTEVKSIKAKGKQLSKFEIQAVKESPPTPQRGDYQSEDDLVSNAIPVIPNEAKRNEESPVQKPEEEPAVKQNIDDIPFEIVTTPKKKKGANETDKQMSLFGE